VRRRWLGGAAAALAALLAAPNVLAADSTAVFQPAANPDSALARMLTEMQGDPIRLQDAVTAALSGGSPAAREGAALVDAAKGELRHQKGAFDPELFGNGLKSSIESPPGASIFTGTKTEASTGSAGLRMLLPFGTQLEASMDGAKTDNNSSFSSLNPQYDAAGRLSINQPLLNGFGPGTKSDLSAAKHETQAALSRYDDVLLGVETVVEEAYWDLYAAQRDLAVQRLIRQQAEAFATLADLREKSGLVGPEDAANARVFLATQTATEIDFEERLDNVSDRLGSLIGRRPSSGLPRFLPVDGPPTDFPIDPVDSLVAIALRENRELKAQEQQLAAQRARAQGAKWNAYPTLDVFGTLGGLGLSGTGQDVTVGGITYPAPPSGDFGDATSQVWNRDYPTWTAGLQLSVPIGLRSGLGDYQRINAEADRLAEALDRAQRTTADNVRLGYRALVNAKRRLAAAEMGVVASREQVRIGILQYNNGRNTAFELVRLGADLATAQQRYSFVLVLTAKAAAELRFLTSGAYPARTHTEGGTKP
jgi:outer membrane protein TolC